MRGKSLPLIRRSILVIYGVVLPICAVLLFLSAERAEQSDPGRFSVNVIYAIVWCLYLWGSAVAFTENPWRQIYPQYEGAYEDDPLPYVMGCGGIVAWIVGSVVIAFMTLTYMFRNSWEAQVVAVSVGSIILGVPGVISVIKLIKFTVH